MAAVAVATGMGLVTLLPVVPIASPIHLGQSDPASSHSANRPVRRIGPTWKAVQLAGTALVVGAAVFLSGRTANEFIRRASRQPSSPIRVVANWRDVAAEGYRDGPVDAKVTIVVFWDYECPTCTRWVRRTMLLREQYLDELAVVYRPVPLDYHHRGAEAAVAAECAATQGRFIEFHRALIQAGDSFDARPWSQVALAAGVADTDAYQRCLKDERTVSRLKPHAEVAAVLGVKESPSFLVDGDLFTGIPWDYELIVKHHLHASHTAGSMR